MARRLVRKLIKPDEYMLKLRVIVVPAPNATSRIAGPAPEVCAVEYGLDSSGNVIETKRLYDDPARD